MDKQIINLCCSKCGIHPQEGIVILNVNGMWLCGKCYMVLNEKMKKIMKEVVENG